MEVAQRGNMHRAGSAIKYYGHFSVCEAVQKSVRRSTPADCVPRALSIALALRHRDERPCFSDQSGSISENVQLVRFVVQCFKGIPEERHFSDRATCVVTVAPALRCSDSNAFSGDHSTSSFKYARGGRGVVISLDRT